MHSTLTSERFLFKIQCSYSCFFNLSSSSRPPIKSDTCHAHLLTLFALLLLESVNNTQFSELAIQLFVCCSSFFLSLIKLHLPVVDRHQVSRSAHGLLDRRARCRQFRSFSWNGCLPKLDGLLDCTLTGLRFDRVDFFVITASYFGISFLF